MLSEEKDLFDRQVQKAAIFLGGKILPMIRTREEITNDYLNRQLSSRDFNLNHILAALTKLTSNFILKDIRLGEERPEELGNVLEAFHIFTRYGAHLGNSK